MLRFNDGTEEVMLINANQLKSAVGNNGDLSANNNSILFSRKVPKQERLQPEWADLNGETFLTKFLRKYQDKLLDLKDVVKNIQNTVVVLNEQFNGYLHLQLMPIIHTN